MQPVHESKLPEYHSSAVYKLVFDYDFAAIKRDDSTVNIRVDYTNLVPYWDEMTGSDSDMGTKRSLESRHEKRWWGSFTDWLKKMTKVEASDEGKLPMSLHKRMLLYRKRASCARGNVKLKAGLDVILDAKLDMNARWAYYASGTIVPLAIDNVYTYFEMEPVAQAVLEVAGNAEMEWVSKRLKIIDTLSYPGLAIKGIAAIGPTLDLYGQMKAKATISGQLRAGAKITFPKQSMYFPQVEEAKDYIKQPQATKGDESGSKGTGKLEVLPHATILANLCSDFVPILDAAVQASVNVDLLITPEVNLGIKVTAPKVSGDVLNAQIVGFVNNTFSFEVQADGKAGTGNTPAGSYRKHTLTTLFRIANDEAATMLKT
jgi:hypothetical protein